jgi:hypothetical protein
MRGYRKADSEANAKADAEHDRPHATGTMADPRAHFRQWFDRIRRLVSSKL